MPTLAFLPWAAITEPLRFGAFRLTPYRDAVGAGAREPAAGGDAIPPELAPAAAAVVDMYPLAARPRREVDRGAVPLLGRHGADLLADPTDPQAAALFGFRARLAFASLAARDRRGLDRGYWNSDALRLVVQGFTRDRAGATLLSYWTRFGPYRAFHTPGTYTVRRPGHVHHCELPRDLDAPLLTALEEAAARGGALWDRLRDAVQLFVRASSDNPDVSPHAELVDLVGVFTRFANSYQKNAALDALQGLLPAPPAVPRGPGGPPEGSTEGPPEVAGPKLGHPTVRGKLAEGRPLRTVWLADAFELRHELAHGKVDAPRKTVWTLPEHLLLASWLVPLLVKAALRGAGLYEFTDEDDFRNAAFEHLAALEPFVVSNTPADDEADDPEADDPASRGPWADTLAELRMRAAGDAIRRLWEQNRGQPGWGAVLDTPLPDDAAGDEGPGPEGA